uniref:Uncharacterized protein n=1 Tax=Panagrolaimus davidi TaxID=227884 RepID=A0A914PR12_9BILA
MFKTFLLLSLFFGAVVALRHQSVGVKGILLCGGAPAKNVRVKLWDEDSGPDPDDLLDQGYTNSAGEFSLKGGTTELTNIDAVFKIYHDCDDGIKPGSRKVKFQIPNSYVTDGAEPKKIFDIGTLNLETIFAKEERELIVSKRNVPQVSKDSDELAFFF